MEEYIIEIGLKTHTLLGSGEGLGSIIDTDVIIDDLGLPYFPGRRLKGLMKETTEEVMEMFRLSKGDYFDEKDLEEIFGCLGDDKGSGIRFNNLYLSDYSSLRSWLNWIYHQYDTFISPGKVTDSLCDIRQQTAINRDGIAKDNSLRTIRVLKPGLIFKGPIYIRGNRDVSIDLLALACLNLRHIGTNRNKGLGEVECRLLCGKENITDKKIEGLERGEVVGLS